MAAHMTLNPNLAPVSTKEQFSSKFKGPAASSAARVPIARLAFAPAAKSTVYVVSFNGEPLPNWVRPTISALNEIGSLPENWDTYGAKAANPDLMRESFSILQLVMQPTSPAPSVVPLSDGGIQLEWHQKSQDLEITFPMFETAQYYYKSRATGVVQEGSAEEIGSLARLMGGLT